MAHGGTQNAVASVPPSSEQRENTNSSSSSGGCTVGSGSTNNANNNTTSSSSMNNFCSACSIQFESSSSLQVHIQNHHHNQPVTAAADSSDSTPISSASVSVSASSSSTAAAPSAPTNGGDPNQQQQALNSYNRSDYSANQLPNYHHHHHHHHQQQQQQQQLPPSEMHYPSYMSNYDQYYHQHSMEYGLPPPPPIPTHHYLNNLAAVSAAAAAAGEYKVVPSSNRFHPYGGNNLAPHPFGSSAAAAAHHQQQHQQQQQQNGSALTAAAQSSMSSPSIVTSSSPIQNNLMNSSIGTPNTIISGGQPTPSPSPRQCDKCGVVCETISQLSEHQVTAHNATPTTPNNNGDAIINRNTGDIENDIPSFHHYSSFGHPHHHRYTHDHAHQHVKDEPSQHQPPDCDILDLDSQKMVYPPHELQQQQQQQHQLQQQAPLPPMHSLHPMQRPMMWPPPHGPPIHAPPHDSNSFLPIPSQNDLKSSMFGSIKNEFSPQIIKQEQSPGHHLTQLPTTPTNPTQSDLTKSFSGGGSDGSQTSPSEFPSTTTPQDNGPQYRTFEAATSSLPNGGPIIKATSWKSNEARRPKTYNCTACNKWFTSSGHLKRHYNTTLHKNAVKSSGQPDPATLPISAHHHPARDPNSKHNRYNNNKTTHNNNSIVQHQTQAQIQSVAAAAAHQQQQQQQQQQLSNESRTPDFASQFSPFATASGNGGGGGGVQQSQQQQQPSSNAAAAMGFPYTTNAMHHQSTNASTATVHPNGQAGLWLVSQSRDLLTSSDLTGAQLHNNNSNSNSNSQHHQLVPDFIQVPQMQPESIITTTMPAQSITSMDHHLCNITTPITINTSITQSYPLMLRPVAEDTNYIIGNHHSAQHSMMMHTGNSNDSIGTTPHSYYGGGGHEYDEPYDSGYPQMSSNCSSISTSSCISAMSSDDEKMIKYSATIPTIAALRRLNHDIHHADTVPPFSPDIPDKRGQNAMQQSYTSTARSLTPQTGETVPTNLSPNAPHHPNYHHQHHNFMTTADIIIKTEASDDTPAVNEPSSPSITSTNTAIGFEQYAQQNQHQQSVTTTKNRNGGGGGKPNKRRTAAETAKLITNTIPPGSDPLRCDPCDKVFNKACYLTQHNKTFHSGEKPFKCQRCGKRFPCDQTHTKHMAKHNGNKPFKCSQCVKQFNHKTDLRRHMCLHTGTKPYVCETCNKGFIRKDHMVKHKLTHTKHFKNRDSTTTTTTTVAAGGRGGNNTPSGIKRNASSAANDDNNEQQQTPMMAKQMDDFQCAAKRRKSIIMMNNVLKAPPSPSPLPIKCHNLNSSNELHKTKTKSQLNEDDYDDDTDESIENKENVNTDVISIE